VDLFANGKRVGSKLAALGDTYIVSSSALSPGTYDITLVTVAPTGAQSDPLAASTFTIAGTATLSHAQTTPAGSTATTTTSTTKAPITTAKACDAQKGKWPLLGFGNALGGTPASHQVLGVTTNSAGDVFLAGIFNALDDNPLKIGNKNYSVSTLWKQFHRQLPLVIK
jgi:hypothetical protein